MANASKWERTSLDYDKTEWRKTKKLGSLLGDTEDIKRRKVLASVSFKSLRSLWTNSKVTSIKTRMNAYNALVLPVLLYNCATWGVAENIIDKLEVYHRRHLREVLGVKTRDIRNEDLYKLCETKPLNRRIVFARWSLFGHVLRLSRDTPAQIAMDYYGSLKEGETEPRGRPDTTLPVLLFNEYKKFKEVKKERGWSVKKSKAQILTELREKAADRKKWREIFTNIVCVVCDS